MFKVTDFKETKKNFFVTARQTAKKNLPYIVKHKLKRPDRKDTFLTRKMTELHIIRYNERRNACLIWPGPHGNHAVLKKVFCPIQGKLY